LKLRKNREKNRLGRGRNSGLCPNDFSLDFYAISIISVFVIVALQIKTYFKTGLYETPLLCNPFFFMLS